MFVGLPWAVEHSNELICLAYANFSRLTAVTLAYHLPFCKKGKLGQVNFREDFWDGY